MENIMKVFTKRQQEIVKENLRAFINNFEYVRIEKEDYGTGFFVYMDKSDSYIQYCYNIDYLNGWLYGCVQAANRREFKQKEQRLY